MRRLMGVAAWLGMAAAVTSQAACAPHALQTITSPDLPISSPDLQPAPPPPNLLDGLVAHWNCDESGGNVLYDTSGKGHDGHITGGTFTTGWFGNALSLQRGQYVTVPTFPNATPSWSVSLWLWVQIPYVKSDVVVMGTELPGTGGWAIRVNSDAQTFTFGFRDGDHNGVDTYASHTGNGVVSDRFVHLVAVVDDQAMTLTLYVDGRIRDSPTPITQTIDPGLPDLLIGRSGLAEEDYAGLIDDIAIYSRALTFAEVTSLHGEAAPNITVPAVSLDAGNDSPDASVSRD